MGEKITMLYFAVLFLVAVATSKGKIVLLHLEVKNIKTSINCVISTAENTIETAKEATGAVNIYNKVLDQVDPWKTFEKAFNDLDKIHGEFSKESVELLGKIKADMLNGIDTYFKSIQSVYEWSSSVENILKTYIPFFEKDNTSITEEQKELFGQVLSKGILTMNQALSNLRSSSTHYNTANGKLLTLYVHLANEITSKKEFYLQKSQDIQMVDLSLKEEVNVVSALKAQAQFTYISINVDIAKELILDANTLLKRCIEFRERHSTPANE